MKGYVMDRNHFEVSPFEETTQMMNKFPMTTVGNSSIFSLLGWTISLQFKNQMNFITI